jgi:hypothetical protein
VEHEERSPPPRRHARRAIGLSDPDRELLEFLSQHRFAHRWHAQRLLGVGERSAYDRLRSLWRRKLVVSSKPLGHFPPCYQITRKGLAAIGSALTRPRAVDLAGYEHDVGVASLWLAARAGVWGELREIVSERRMRSYDLSDARREQLGGPGEPFGVRLGGFGQAGGERLHYPDLLLVDRHGHRIAVELELSSKGRTRRERVLGGYAFDHRIDAVLYLVDRPDVARLLERSAARLGISKMVHVQMFRRPQPTAAPAGPSRTAARSGPDRQADSGAGR